MSRKHHRALPRQAPRHGAKGPGGYTSAYTSANIMRLAGAPGMVSVKVARRLSGYRWGRPSKYEPHQGARERARRSNA